MKIVNDSKMKFAWLAGRVPPRPLTGTFIVKATLEFKPGQSATLIPQDDQLDPDGEKPLNDDPACGPVYPGDFALFKPVGEVLLTGSACAPQGKTVTQMLVSLQVGQWSKSLVVSGDRVWAIGMLSSKLGAPIPFSSMPLTWERAFGGPSFKQNPSGRGMEPIAVPGVGMVPYGPNVEYPKQLVSSASNRPDPGSFAPWGSSWPQRMKNLGSYGGKWLRERWPWFPDDFDWSYFNAAPQDQRLKGFLRGDERIVLEGMHAAYPLLETALPALKPRWFMRQKVNNKPVFEEIPLNLDTLFIDADKSRIVLQWRGIAGIQSLKMKEISDHLLVSEPLGEPDKGLAYFEAMLERRKLEIATEGDEEEVEEEDGTFPLPDLPAPNMKWADLLEQELAKDVADAEKGMADMAKLPVPPGQNVPNLFGPVVMKSPAPLGFADIEKQLESSLSPVRAPGVRGAGLADQKWLTPTLKQDMEEMDQPAKEPPADEEPVEEQPWTRERVEARHKSRGSFEGQELDGLDLAGLDLSRGKFTGASLAACNLSGTLLEGAMLDGAVFEGATLKEAVLKGASLKGADLTKVQGALASFAGAVLDDAVFSGAQLPGANFEKARGLFAEFTGADLSQADFRGSRFEQTDFSGAKLEKLKAAGSHLLSCDIGMAKGAHADFSSATITDVRATGADLNHAALRGVMGEKTAFDQANLEGTDFTEADIPGALFDGAHLKGAVFDRANLVRARFCDADLAGAQLRDANLFRVTLENANLEGANFAGSNMYEAEFYQAATAGARFEGANLKGTKLA